VSRPPGQEHRNGGAAVARTLAAHGAQVAFGIPGTHNLEIYRHLPACGVRPVTARHEQGAGYAADGYAQVSGRPGVVVTTSGPGLTNAVTAAATAYAESRPLLLISPGVPRGTEGRDLGQLHETKDSSGALDRLVAWSRRVASAEEASAAVADAFAFMASGRPRPVHVEVPVDVLEEEWSGQVATACAVPVAPPDPDAVRRAAQVLAGAERPVLLCGGGAVRATAQVRALAERLGAVVVTTCNGKGTLPEDHPLSVGAAVRLRALQQEVRGSDALLVVGSELGDSDLWGGTITAGTVVRCDIEEAQLDKNCRADVHLLGNAADCLDALLAALPPGGPAGEGERRAAALRRACTAEAMDDGAPWAEVNRALRAALPAGATVAGDSSQVTYYGTVHFFEVTAPAQLLYMPGFATLGYGLPAAIGAKLADPARPVAALVGDGALMFSVQELVTAVELRLPLPVVVVDNGGYREIRDQEEARGIPPVGVDLHVPDLPALARACGAAGFDATDADEVATLASAALAADGPTLIRLRV
jgi:thiamine pyrophosphate-dependent acetolactate synthase large subunit-like protein